MPRLNTTTRNLAENSEEVSFGPIPAGKYIARLSKVEAKQSQAGNPFWSCEYDQVHMLDGTPAPGRLWYTLNLPMDGPAPAGYTPRNPNRPPAEAWESRQNIAASRLKGWFHAHGFTLDSDTDEMVGTVAMLTVVQETIQRGQRAGQIGNQVTNVEAAPEGADAVPQSPWDAKFANDEF